MIIILIMVLIIAIIMTIIMIMIILKPLVAQAQETLGASLSYCIQFATPGLLVVLLVTHHLIQPICPPGFEDTWYIHTHWSFDWA